MISQFFWIHIFSSHKEHMKTNIGIKKGVGQKRRVRWIMGKIYEMNEIEARKKLWLVLAATV